MSKSQVPPVVAKYFGEEAVRQQHPVIEQAFAQGTGWKYYPIKKRISASWAGKMRRAGYDKVALRCGSRVADFNLKEMTR